MTTQQAALERPANGATFKALLASMTVIPLSILDDLKRQIDAHAALARIECAGVAVSAHERAKAAVDTAAAEAKDSRERLAKAEANLETRLSVEERGSVAHAGICITGFAALFLCEFYLSLLTLSYVFGVASSSIAAVAISLTPPAALAIMDVLLLELIEGPWQRVKASAARWSRRVTWSARTLVFVTILVGNLGMIWYIAGAREESMRVHDLIRRHAPPAEITIVRATIRHAVVAVALMAALDGALFLLLGIPEAKKVGARVAAVNAVNSGRRRQRVLDKAEREARAERDVRKSEVDSAQESAAQAAIIERTTHAAALEAKLHEHKARRASTELVSLALAGDPSHFMACVS